MGLVMSEQSGSATVGSGSVPEQVAASRSEFAQPFADLDVTNMTLDQLRQMRKILTERESQISYWRRIIQARLDLLRDGALKRGATIEGLQRILSQQMGVNNRKGILSVMPEEDQPMAGLDHLWHRGINSQDDEELERDLIAAERQLSSIRSELHGMIDAATGELVARYREDPLLALTALPTRVQRPSPL
jgi:hypothetical protein